MDKKLKIIHIITSSFGGGVETAGKSFLEYSSNNYDFKVFFLKDKEKQNSFFAYFNSLKKIIKISPDLVLTSLWKSNFIVFLIKIINFKTRYILFLHSTRNKHFVDGFFTTLAAIFAYEIWADSEETFVKELIVCIFSNFIKI